MSRNLSEHHVSVDESKLPVALPSHHHHLMTPSLLPHAQQQTLPLNISPITTRSSTTQHLAVLYQSHHHHHLHSVLSGIRRQSRLPEIRKVQYQEIKA